jgi:hypothetical protein
MRQNGGKDGRLTRSEAAGAGRDPLLIRPPLLQPPAYGLHEEQSQKQFDHNGVHFIVRTLYDRQSVEMDDNIFRLLLLLLFDGDDVQKGGDCFVLMMRRGAAKID